MMIRTVLLTLALVATAQSQQTRNITYTPGETADLYAPTTPGTHPAIVYIHGGSWRSGDKSEFSKLASDLATQGYVGLSINYDLSPHSWPTSLQQSRSAVAFLRAHADEYHINPDRIIVVGTSAGGQLASLVALEPAEHIIAAIILNGVFDLSSGVHVINRYLGGSCISVAPACTDASPIQKIHAGAPPFFIGHGTNDHVVPYGAAKAFIDALQQANVPVTPFVAQNGPHMYWEKKTFYDANLAAIESFLTHLP